MKLLLVSAVALPFLAGHAIAQEAKPFSLKHYGHFKKMNHMKKTDGVVNINKANNQPYTYGVGAPAHGTGEITIANSKLWLDYGADGLGKAKHKIGNDEQAVLLVTAQVKSWREIIVPDDMTNVQMHKFILDQATSHGINANAAFPFLLEGTYYDFAWHILNGRKKHGGGHGAGGLFKKIVEARKETKGSVVGFYSAKMQGVFTHPGESWHLHVIFADEGKAGHIDKISVRKGSVLKLPAS